MQLWKQSEARQMLELLAELEGFACALACPHGSADGIRDIAQLHEAMLIAHRAGDMSRYFKLNQDIHDGIVALSGNLALVESHRRLSLTLHSVWKVVEPTLAQGASNRMREAA